MTDEDKRRFSEQFKQVEGIVNQVAAKFDQVDERFDQVDERFDQVDERFNQVEANVSQIEASLRQELLATEHRIIEATRDMQTELLGGFQAFAVPQNIRLRR